jgi:hypothetical protein
MDTTLLKELKRIKIDIKAGLISTSGELTNRVLTAFAASNAGLSLPRFVPSEPPSSTKINFLTKRIESTLRDKEYIFDLLQAAAVFEYDEAMKALDSLEDKIAGLGDSVRTLYFYTQPFRSNMHVVGVDFTNSWGFFKNPGNSMHLNVCGGLTLPVLRQDISTATVSIDGDGMSGSWYIVDAAGELIADTETNDKFAYLLDSNPTTMYEYGRFQLSEEQALATHEYGFGFSDTDYKWASTDYNDVNCDLTLDLSKVINCNYLVLQPSISAHQFTVKSVTLYLADQAKKTLTPQNLVVNQELLMKYEAGYTNSAVYVFEPTLTDKIIVALSSNYPVETKVRHFYSLDSDGARVAGESPSSNHPHIYISSGLTDSTSKQEEMMLKRYYIGLKDIVIQSNTYGTEGVVSTPEPIKFGKQIDRVGLTADYDIPEGTALKFELSFDGGKWYTIHPLGTSLTNQIIAVNDRVPGAYRDPSTTYISLDYSPKEFWARVTATRKTGTEYISPIVRNIQYEIVLKD